MTHAQRLPSNHYPTVRHMRSAFNITQQPDSCHQLSTTYRTATHTATPLSTDKSRMPVSRVFNILRHERWDITHQLTRPYLFPAAAIFPVAAVGGAEVKSSCRCCCDTSGLLPYCCCATSACCAALLLMRYDNQSTSSCIPAGRRDCCKMGDSEQ